MFVFASDGCWLYLSTTMSYCRWYSGLWIYVLCLLQVPFKNVHVYAFYLHRQFKNAAIRSVYYFISYLFDKGLRPKYYIIKV